MFGRSPSLLRGHVSSTRTPSPRHPVRGRHQGKWGKTREQGGASCRSLSPRVTQPERLGPLPTAPQTHPVWEQTPPWWPFAAPSAPRAPLHLTLPAHGPTVPPPVCPTHEAPDTGTEWPRPAGPAQAGTVLLSEGHAGLAPGGGVATPAWHRSPENSLQGQRRSASDTASWTSSSLPEPAREGQAGGVRGAGRPAWTLQRFNMRGAWARACLGSGGGGRRPSAGRLRGSQDSPRLLHTPGDPRCPAAGSPGG